MSNITIDKEGWGWRKWWLRVNGYLVAQFHKSGDAYEMAYRLNYALRDMENSGADGTGESGERQT